MAVPTGSGTQVLKAHSFDDVDFQNMDNNALHCRIEFYLNNVPAKLEEVDVLLKRVR